jgi:lipopolysaccharide/colanic/teichoic acid biosynthesis glycosyltransferase
MNLAINNINNQTSHSIKHKKNQLKQEPLKGYSPIQYFQKRLIDIVMTTTLLTITLPVTLYTIYRIKKESPGPIFFTQSRIGLGGKAFTCYKFRSMHINGQFNPYTQENDSRIFPFGNTMRKMRIDELPQLFNILKGEMHLLGPRAEWDILVKDYENIIPHYHDRHLVRPGITGLAQVSYPYGRNVRDAKEKLKYDLHYIKNWSLTQEIKVIFKTILVVLGKKGM